jgi:hypothetical protein
MFVPHHEHVDSVGPTYHAFTRAALQLATAERRAGCCERAVYRGRVKCNRRDAVAPAENSATNGAASGATRS